MNIYVGNLSYSVTEDKLRDLFSAYGEVSLAKIIIDKMTGKSKGFGFVEMTSSADAQAAIEGLNGTDVDGRQLRISEARPRDESAPRGNNGGGRRPSSYPRSNNNRY